MKNAIMPPAATIGILSDGQLARMTILDGVRLGFTFRTLGPGGLDSPAGQVTPHALRWGPQGEVSDVLLSLFCDGLSVCLIDSENVSVELVERIEAKGILVCPNSKVLRTAQDRLQEKLFARSVGVPVGEFRCIDSEKDVSGVLALALHDTILKTRRGGYDGKGQARIRAGESIEAAWRSADIKCAPCILEKKIAFAHEVSVIVARSSRSIEPYPNEVSSYAPFENTHKEGILRTTGWPAKCRELTDELMSKAMASTIRYAETLADELGAEGLLALECFVMHDGTVLFNEMAPRPHNSGHVTIDCAVTSQFTQYVLAACGLPLGSVRMHSQGTMNNLIGHDIDDLDTHLWSNVLVHLYGKTEVKDGRKMGHIIYSSPLPDLP